jgi:hypothetical protein
MPQVTAGSLALGVPGVSSYMARRAVPPSFGDLPAIASAAAGEERRAE